MKILLLLLALTLPAEIYECKWISVEEEPAVGLFAKIFVTFDFDEDIRIGNELFYIKKAVLHFFSQDGLLHPSWKVNQILYYPREEIQYRDTYINGVFEGVHAAGAVQGEIKKRICDVLGTIVIDCYLSKEQFHKYERVIKLIFIEDSIARQDLQAREDSIRQTDSIQAYYQYLHDQDSISIALIQQRLMDSLERIQDSVEYVEYTLMAHTKNLELERQQSVQDSTEYTESVFRREQENSHNMLPFVVALSTTFVIICAVIKKGTERK